MDGLLLQQAPNSPGQWAVVALGVVTVLYVAVVRPMRKGKRKDPLDRPPAHLSLAQQRAVEGNTLNPPRRRTTRLGSLRGGASGSRAKRA